MAASDTAQHLRVRATELHRLARRIEQSTVVGSYREAGDATWLGPTPQQCSNDLLGWRRRLLDRAQDLHDAARRLERMAETLAAAAAAPVGGR